MTDYEKTILTYDAVFLLIALANLTIGIWNMMANRNVARHANELHNVIKQAKEVKL